MDAEFEITRTHLAVAGLIRHGRELPDHVALTGPGGRLTYGQLLARVKQVAARLAALGVRRGDRVAYIAGNSVHFPIPVYATWWLGATIVPVNFRLAAAEMAFILGDSAPCLVISDAEHRATVTAALATLDVRHVGLEEFTAPGSANPSAEKAPDPVLVTLEDDAAIMYTSGTTGRPKGTVLTHSNFHSVVTRVALSWRYASGQEVVLIATPMFHIAAFDFMLTNLAYAATSVVMPSGGFDVAALLDTMARHRVSKTFLVPAQWQAVVNEQRRQPRQLNLQFYAWGAAPGTQSLLTSLREIFPGAESQAAFGQTETSAIGVSLAHADSLRKLGAVGLADNNFSIRVVDPEMNDVATGEVGEIVYRGPGVMSRYWHNDAATVEAFRGGWFHSGDLVRLDDEGFIYVVDRLKDMIISGGENIYSAELENVIAWHTKVAAVAVVGRADPRWGEIPVALVIPKNPAEAPTLAEIRAFCEGKLAHYKMPKELILRDSFPLSGTGKVQKTILRSEIERPPAS
jgi:acyl-CoA synthetase (AMP-forming)/AMP-acid ligase II